jgi:putative transposase
MDGHGRALDTLFVERLWRSVKYGDLYLRGYAGLPELLGGLTRYFEFYNQERKHPSLGYLTPDPVYRTGIGGRARIVDPFNSGTSNPAPAGQRRSAASDPAPS